MFTFRCVAMFGVYKRSIQQWNSAESSSFLTHNLPDRKLLYTIAAFENKSPGSSNKYNWQVPTLEPANEADALRSCVINDYYNQHEWC